MNEIHTQILLMIIAVAVVACEIFFILWRIERGDHEACRGSRDRWSAAHLQKCKEWAKEKLEAAELRRENEQLKADLMRERKMVGAVRAAIEKGRTLNLDYQNLK